MPNSTVGHQPAQPPHGGEMASTRGNRRCFAPPAMALALYNPQGGGIAGDPLAVPGWPAGSGPRLSRSGLERCLRRYGVS